MDKVLLTHEEAKSAVHVDRVVMISLSIYICIYTHIKSIEYQLNIN